MSYNAKQVSDLRAELTNDPLTRGYSGMSDSQVASSLLGKTREVDRTSMTRQEVYESIDSTELAALTAVQLAQINLTLSDTVDPFGNAVAVFVDVFGGGSATVTALAAARKEFVSRLVELGLSEIESISLEGWITEIRGS